MRRIMTNAAELSQLSASDRILDLASGGREKLCSWISLGDSKVSIDTIRRDFDDPGFKHGLSRRVHGGACPQLRSRTPHPAAERRRTRPKEEWAKRKRSLVSTLEVWF